MEMVCGNTFDSKATAVTHSQLCTYIYIFLECAGLLSFTTRITNGLYIILSLLHYTVHYLLLLYFKLV